MTPRDRETLGRKLEYLRGTLEEIVPYRKLTLKEYLHDRLSQLIVERLLQLAIESVMDCSRLLVFIMGWRRVREESDALLILVRHKLITQKHAERLLKAKGFRNILVHEYVELDQKQVYRNLQKGFTDLQNFAKALAKWLEKK